MALGVMVWHQYALLRAHGIPLPTPIAAAPCLAPTTTSATTPPGRLVVASRGRASEEQGLVAVVLFWLPLLLEFDFLMFSVPPTSLRGRRPMRRRRK
ncbi:hypothetical protein U1Q18_035877 [Sarracenia purpurea var. burkii]